MYEEDESNTTFVQNENVNNEHDLTVAPHGGEQWNSSAETINLRENVKWLENNANKKLVCEKMMKWMKRGQHGVDDTNNFVDLQVLKDVLEAKNIFCRFDLVDILNARSRANVFETIYNVFFMNRAALKMANIDAITDFMFTSLDYDTIHRRKDGPYYFADVCAGPGGFTEYILWRKKWCYKGFGFTLKGEHDFKLEQSPCISSNSFRAFYGSNRDGNVYDPDNIDDFKEVVLRQTGGAGVHFMMSDGGFSVEGHEDQQEILSKQLYVCQCLMALEIVRSQGYFVTKMFDLFTRFSVGLIYLMHQCFDKIAIAKLNSSRPANSERYLICKRLRNTAQTAETRKYLREIVKELWLMKDKEDALDILEIVPQEILKQDTQFFKHIFESNTTIAERQKVALLKLESFCQNPNLIETRQETFRSKCLALWHIPDKKRLQIKPLTIDNIINDIDQPDFILTRPNEIHDALDFKNVIVDENDWKFAPLFSSERSSSCHIFASTLDSRVYKFARNKWTKVPNLKLNKGTVLYGEIVKEKCVSKREGIETEKLSLHVIDALRLGDTSLADLPFDERTNCIKIFCEAINFEAAENDFRIRPKIIKPLNSLCTENVVEYDRCKYEYVTHFDTFGSVNSEEYQFVDSLLLLKTDSCETFKSTYVSRALIYVNGSTVYDDITLCFGLAQLIDQLNSINKS